MSKVLFSVVAVLMPLVFEPILIACGVMVYPMLGWPLGLLYWLFLLMVGIVVLAPLSFQVDEWREANRKKRMAAQQ